MLDGVLTIFDEELGQIFGSNELQGKREKLPRSKLPRSKITEIKITEIPTDSGTDLYALNL